MSDKVYSGIYADTIFKVYGRHLVVNGKHYIRVPVGIMYPVNRESIREEKGDRYMNLNDYQQLAARTHNRKLTAVEAITNYALGLTGESGEVADHVKKHVFHSHELDVDEVKKELGDVLWYVANLAAVLEIELSEVAGLNLEKLKKRYRNGFSEVDSIHREDIK